MLSLLGANPSLGIYGCIAEALGPHPVGGNFDADFNDRSADASSNPDHFSAIRTAAVEDTASATPLVVTTGDNNDPNDGRHFSVTFDHVPPLEGGSYALAPGSGIVLRYSEGVPDGGPGAAWIASAGTIVLEDFEDLGKPMNFKLAAELGPVDGTGAKGHFTVNARVIIFSVVKPDGTTTK